MEKMNRKYKLAYLMMVLFEILFFILIGGNIMAQEMNDQAFSEITFYVSNDGNDRWSGRISEPNESKTDGPFASLKRAKDAVSNLECRYVAGELRRNVNIIIRGGVYYLNEPLVFSPDDAGSAKCSVTFSAYKNEKVIISGGRKITEWQKKDESKPIWSAKLPDSKWFFRTLRIGDKQAIRARYPNFDAENPLTGGWIFVSKDIPENAYDRIIFKAEDFPNWADWEGAEVHIFPAWGWVNTIMKVKNVNKENKEIYVDCKQDIRPGNRFFVANVKDALDSPGEWCLNNGEVLYWADDKEFPNVDVVAPIMDRLIVLQGDIEKEKYVENIHFVGLTFKDTDYSLDGYYDPADSAIWLNGAKNCSIQDCVFDGVSGYAVRLAQRSHENKIIGNSMKKLGQGGVILLGNTANQPYNNIIEDNDIQDCGKIYKHVAGVYITTGSGNKVAHNNIYRMPRYGISFKSYDQNNSSHNNIAEYNRIIDTNLETNDTGAIETLGRDYQLSGNIIRFNLIRNVVGLNTTPDGKIITPYFTWGIYLDDYSSGTTVYGNIVDGNVIGGICIHGGKNNIFENNIFMNGLERQLTLQPRDDFMTGNIFKHNIIVYKNTNSVIWYSWQNTWQKDRLAECDYNLYWNTDGLDIANVDRHITPEGKYSSWLAVGFDHNSIIADPMFISLDDFQLNENSPAFKINFKPINVDLIGIRRFKDK
jgi:parallel beta-helix repeat protein